MASPSKHTTFEDSIKFELMKACKKTLAFSVTELERSTLLISKMAT
jgi:hypothetical protein